ncbi:ATP-binding protein [Leptolyngbya sp. FACHB-711]|uniref:ATP-binding protein n=1 Tax=unclassified Leptolyngbya TaxID=2650499 RepID=UPI001684F5EE|nr:ATP-binding protein [Leptolyngbya sp. FACHB-711]MBD1849517.1 HAMP domain-containing histidine kinase [Cyanobacteria bacterium FACHB-502]MBD2025596.1 HAMP domain-containing histidine kinase [Leptolyngbya sp. FACHB-711]
MTFKISGNTKGFWGDQQLLRLILINLLLNPIKSSPSGSEIELHLTGNSTHIAIEVKDKGTDLPAGEQVLQSVRNSSKDSDGSDFGTISANSLNLAIVQACTQLHGGEISWVSPTGKAAQFTVRLPKRIVE